MNATSDRAIANLLADIEFRNWLESLSNKELAQEWAERWINEGIDDPLLETIVSRIFPRWLDLAETEARGH